MKYFLVMIIAILSAMLVNANDPEIINPQYDVFVTDKKGNLNLVIPSSVGQTSYGTIEKRKDDLLNCLVSLHDNEEKAKSVVYNIKKIAADVAVYLISENQGTFKLMVVYTRPELILNDTLNTANTQCNFLNSNSTTTRWFGDVKIGTIVAINALDGNQLYLKIENSK